MMLTNLLLGFTTMALCLLLQSLLLLAAMRYYKNHWEDLNSPSMLASLLVVNMVMVLLVGGNLGQIAIWALLFQFLGEFESFAQAYYHSAVNFATLGYGDIVMTERYRLLGPLESVNGVLMIGLSTAALLSAFQDAIKRTLGARKNPGA
jgi:hypothetical protein